MTRLLICQPGWYWHAEVDHWHEGCRQVVGDLASPSILTTSPCDSGQLLFVCWLKTWDKCRHSGPKFTSQALKTNFNLGPSVRSITCTCYRTEVWAHIAHCRLRVPMPAAYTYTLSLGIHVLHPCNKKVINLKSAPTIFKKTRDCRLPTLTAMSFRKEIEQRFLLPQNVWCFEQIFLFYCKCDSNPLKFRTYISCLC